jgi:cytochrome oxidase assembly protein ShyY1
VYRFALAPRWLALHAALLVVVGAFGVLGWWQWDSASHNDRERTEGSKGLAVALADVAEPGLAQVGGLAGQVVTVEGRYDAAAQLLVPGREREGRVGFYVVTPLRTAEGAVAVNRGWVPAPTDVSVPAPGGAVRLTGVLQPSETSRVAGTGALGTLPEGQIPYIATTQLTGRLPYPPSQLYDGFVLLSSQQPAAEPAPAPVDDTAVSGTSGVSVLRNISYAFQWWIFAVAALAFWAMFLRHAAADRRTAAVSTAAGSSSGDSPATAPDPAPTARGMS